MIEIVELSDIDRKRVLAALRCYRASIDYQIRHLQAMADDPNCSTNVNNLLAYNQTELRDLDQLIQTVKEKPIITR